MAKLNSVVGLCVILLLVSVHGRQAVARIRFQSSEYTFLEGETSMCLMVVNEAPPEQTAFSVSYEFDSVLLGMGRSGTLTGSLRFSAGMSVEPLCIPHFSNNEIACELDTVGTVRLLNNTAIETTKPCTATVRVKDDDPVIATFQEPSHIFSESSGGQQLLVMFTDRSIATPITLQVSGASTDLQQSHLVPSLLPVSTEFTEMGQLHTYQPQLQITDDSVGLEDPENITISLSAVSHHCYDVQFSPYGQTQVIILDDDDVRVGVTEQFITAVESEGVVEVCVDISAEIARPLPFTLTTHHGTATDREDYTGGIFAGQFNPSVSQIRQLCIPVTILIDNVIESNEVFTVQLAVDSLPERRLEVVSTTTVITIKDSSQCIEIGLSADSEAFYVLNHTSVCFTCHHDFVLSDYLETMNVTWLLRGQQIDRSEGDVLQNGTLVIYNSSKVFQTQSATVLVCTTGEYTVTIAIMLGSEPRVLSITTSTQITDLGLELILTCTFIGAPPPNVTWLFQDTPLSALLASVETTSSSSILTLSNATADQLGQYTCRTANEFGSDSATATVFANTEDPSGGGTGGIHSAAAVNRKSLPLFVLFGILVYMTRMCN